MLTGLLTLMMPDKTITKASPDPPFNQAGLDLNYIWEEANALANITYTAYPPNTLPKGRSYGSLGGNTTVSDIIKPEFFEAGFPITEQPIKGQYSKIINITDFELSVNSAANFPYQNPISKKEMYIQAIKQYNVTKWNLTYPYDNLDLLPVNMTKLMPFHYFRDKLTIHDYDYLNDNHVFFMGNLSYIGPNDPIPDEDIQSISVFLLDDVDGAQEILDMIENAEGVIIVKTDDEIHYVDASEITNYPVLAIDSDDGGQIKGLLENHIIFVDSIALLKTLTFSYNFNSPLYPWPENDFLLLDRIPNHLELRNATLPNNLLMRLLAASSLFGHEVNKSHCTFTDYSNSVSLKAWFYYMLGIIFHHDDAQCRGVILYDSGNYHYMLSPNSKSIPEILNYMTKSFPPIAYITVN